MRRKRVYIDRYELSGLTLAERIRIEEFFNK